MTLFVTIGAILLVVGLPSSIADIPASIGTRIRLGLDLRGGTRLVMGVVTDDAIRAETDLAGEVLQGLLVEEGILDSFGLAELVALIESRYGVKVPDGDIALETFGSIEKIVAYVAGKS